MRIWKDSATIEEKLPSQVKRGDGSNVRGKNREEWDCFLLGKDAHTRSTKNEHAGGHVSNGSEIYLEVSLCHILGHIYNSYFDICVFFFISFSKLKQMYSLFHAAHIRGLSFA